jgi:sarcosine oxidase
MADQSCDVAIIGGGGMGASTAYFLAQMGGGHLKVAVFERDPTYAHASTALAAGGIRQQFSTPENILMSQFGYQFFERLGEALAVEGERPDIGLTPRPYLRLVAEAGREALREHCELQRSLGAGSTWLEPAELAARFPWMNVEGVAAAILGGAGEGLFDPYSLLQALRRKGQALGVTYHTAQVVGLELDGGKVSGVRLADGSVVSCGMAVNAAGPRAAGVAAMAGLALPVAPFKAQSFAFRAERPVGACPVVLDQAGGVQFKPEGPLFVCAAPNRGQDGPCADDDFDTDLGLFEEVAWPRLAARVPQFESLKLVRGWTGHVEINTFDANPVLGLHPERPNLYFVVGFSGHGAQHVPAGGRAIAELILYGEYRSLDLGRFGYDRVLRGEPVAEVA